MSSFNRFVDEATHDFLMAIYNGATMEEAMKHMTVAHADRLGELGFARTLALDPCPRCGGTVLATENTARCAAGCGFRYDGDLHEPIASRRADP